MASLNFYHKDGTVVDIAPWCLMKLKSALLAFSKFIPYLSEYPLSKIASKEWFSSAYHYALDYTSRLYWFVSDADETAPDYSKMPPCTANAAEQYRFFRIEGIFAGCDFDVSIPEPQIEASLEERLNHGYWGWCWEKSEYAMKGVGQLAGIIDDELEAHYSHDLWLNPLAEYICELASFLRFFSGIEPKTGNDGFASDLYKVFVNNNVEKYYDGRKQVEFADASQITELFVSNWNSYLRIGDFKLRKLIDVFTDTVSASLDRWGDKRIVKLEELARKLPDNECSVKKFIELAVPMVSRIETNPIPNWEDDVVISRFEYSLRRVLDD